MPIVTFSYSISSSDGVDMEPFYKSTTSAIKQKFINIAHNNAVIGNPVLQPIDKKEYAEPFIPFYLTNNWNNHRRPIKQVFDYPDSNKVFRVLHPLRR